MADTSSSSTTRTVMAVIAVVAWFALLLQLFLMIATAAKADWLRALVNYFSFFTILSNLLVAVDLSLPLLAPAAAPGRFFARPSAQSAIAVYIAVVGITYTLLLRHLWNPQGAQKIADVLLHDVVPVLYVGFWTIFVPKATLRWPHAVQWLAYPIAYMVYTLLHGFISGWYPYYFIDVGALGYPRALVNAAAILLAFLGLGLLAVAIGRVRSKKSSPSTLSR